MSTSSACFENIIGLSRTACPCVDDAPVGANVSASGLFLDELPGLNLKMLNATQACGSGGLWEKLEALKADYEREFQKRVLEFLCPTLAGHDSINRYGDCRKCKDTWGMHRGTIPN